MIKSDDVIQYKDLIYESFRQSRGEGFSGQLLLATEANNPDKRYVIKAATAHVAACEFMFHKLAQKLELRTARVRFVAPAKPGDFAYPACAVDYIPNAEVLRYEDFIKIPECEVLSYLSYILGDRDNLDFLRDESGRVYKIDHADCFGIEATADTWINPKNITFGYTAYQQAKPVPSVWNCTNEIMQEPLERIAALSITDFEDDLGLILKFCSKPFYDHFRYWLIR